MTSPTPLLYVTNSSTMTSLYLQVERAIKQVQKTHAGRVKKILKAGAKNMKKRNN